MINSPTLLGKPVVFVKDRSDFFYRDIILGDFSAYVHEITIIKCCDSPDIVANHDNTGYVCPNCKQSQKVIRSINKER